MNHRKRRELSFGNSRAWDTGRVTLKKSRPGRLRVSVQGTHPQVNTHLERSFSYTPILASML